MLSLHTLPIAVIDFFKASGTHVCPDFSGALCVLEALKIRLLLQQHPQFASGSQKSMKDVARFENHRRRIVFCVLQGLGS